MKPKTSPLHHRADFINKKGFHDDASIFSSITEETYSQWNEKEKKKNPKTGYFCSLKIRDCDRTISLDINIDDEENYSNSIFKVEKMIEHLAAFSQALKSTNEKIKQRK